MKNSHKKDLPALPNFVAKHMHEANRCQVFIDRKKNEKRGYSKHKKGRHLDASLFLCRFAMV